ncbi:hypothetical protein FBUS_00142 [Fasciolopsis buskii]|uniref:Uncharacterized protein n=1 Tax=Fasciolopsis buskii TaxID=27845 RepID=A0A8E0S9U3_9TREM|nr:hypothetical protein FBUS_00142 [Fasciolopsis buski]
MNADEGFAIGINQSNLCPHVSDHFVYLIPTDQLDDYLEGLIHSSLPVVNLQTLQPLPHTAHAGATTATASVSQFPANCAATAFEIDPEGQCTIMAPQVSVDESSDERVSRLSTSCFQPPSPRLTRVETSDTNHESENSNQSEPVQSTGALKLSTIQAEELQDSTDQRSLRFGAFGRPFSPLLADDDEEEAESSQSAKVNGDQHVEMDCNVSGETETRTVILNRPKQGGLGLTIVGYVYKLPDCSKCMKCSVTFRNA